MRCGGADILATHWKDAVPDSFQKAAPDRQRRADEAPRPHSDRRRLVDIGRRTFLGIAAGSLIACTVAERSRVVTVLKSPTCGCCGDWVNHLRASGFEVTVEEVE